MALQLQMKETTLGANDKKDFLMLAAHPKSGEKKDEEPAKEAQGAELAAIIAKHNKGFTDPKGIKIPAMPVIFACDFNNRPGGVTHNSFFGELREGNLSKITGTNVTSAYGDVLTQWRCPSATRKHPTFWKGADHGFLTPQQRVKNKFCPICKANGEKKLPACLADIEKFQSQLKATDEEKTDKDELKKLKKKLEQAEELKKRFRGVDLKKLLTIKLTREPEFTTNKWRKGGAQKEKQGITNQTIDYIFYTPEIECSQVLDTPTEVIELFACL